MLDVHAPHMRLEGVKEILLHLFVITLGLLIATQIEACEEWRGHMRLAEEARQSLRAEIQQNVSDMESAEPRMEAWQKQIASNLDLLDTIQRHPNDASAQNGELTIAAHWMRLRDTAWRTAQSTGALAYMPYAEAQRYAEIYAAQDKLLKEADRPTENFARAYALAARFGLDKSSRMTADQAGALKQEFGQAAFHLAESDALLRQNIELNQAFLQGREPRGYLHQSLR